MSLNDEKFDHEVKKVFQSVQSEEIPVDFLVDIEQRLDQFEKKKKRRIALWFFVGFVFAGGLTAGAIHLFRATEGRTVHASHQRNEWKSTHLLKKEIAVQSNISQIHQKGMVEKEQAYPSFQASNGPQFLLTDLDASNVLYEQFPNSVHSEVFANDTLSQYVKKEPNVEKTRFENMEKSDNKSMDSIQKELNAIAQVEQTTAETIQKTQEVNPLPEKKKWHHSFGIYTGLSGIISSFHADDQLITAMVGTINAQKYREIRSTQERATSSIDLSLRYRLAKDHLVLQTGLDFFEWGEQIKYDYLILFDGVNRYSYVSLPFYIGYRKTLGSFEWTSSFGSSVGHVIAQQGTYIQPDLTTLALENAQKWSFTGMAQFDVSYVRDRFRFSVAPTCRMSIGNIVNSPITKNRYYSIGLQIGMMYHFK